MAHMLGYVENPRETAWHAASWAAHHVAVYVGVAGVAAVLFLVGATAYAYLWPADVISIEMQSPLQGPAIDVGAPPPLTMPATPGHRLNPAEALVVGLSNPFATGNLIGLDVWDSNKERVGTITDLLLDHNGSAHGIVVGLSGYWLTKKYVVIPFKDFTWEYEPSSQNTPVIAHGNVPYKRDHLQRLPPAGDPWVPLDKPNAPGAE